MNSYNCNLDYSVTKHNGILFNHSKEEQDVFVKHNAPDNGQFQQGQDHKDKYFDTSRNILSQEMIMYNMEAFSILSLRSYDQCQIFFPIVQMSRSKD